MRCTKCGMELGEKDVFCPNCGQAVQRGEVNNNVERNQNTYAYERPVNQQNNYNQQQRVNQQNYGQQPYQNKNSGDIVKICLIALVAVIIVVASVVITYLVVSKGNKNNNNNQGNNPTSSSTTADNDSNGVTSISNKKSSSYKVNYAGFKLYIPDNLMYEIDSSNNMIMIGDAESTWIAQMGIKEGSFQTIKQNKEVLAAKLKDSMKSYNATISNAMVETIGGVEYILLECSLAGQNGLIGYAGVNSMYTAFFELFNEDNDFNRDIIKNISSILSSAEYTGDSTYLKSDENVKFTDITDAFDKAMEE